MAGQHHHGSTPAAWTAVVIVTIGFGVGSAFTVMAEPLGVLAGAVIAALGGVAGLVLRAMGMGQPQAAAHGTARVPAQKAAEADQAPARA